MAFTPKGRTELGWRVYQNENGDTVSFAPVVNYPGVSHRVFVNGKAAYGGWHYRDYQVNGKAARFWFEKATQGDSAVKLDRRKERERKELARPAGYVSVTFGLTRASDWWRYKTDSKEIGEILFRRRGQACGVCRAYNEKPLPVHVAEYGAVNWDGNYGVLHKVTCPAIAKFTVYVLNTLDGNRTVYWPEEEGELNEVSFRMEVE